MYTYLQPTKLAVLAIVQLNAAVVVSVAFELLQKEIKFMIRINLCVQ